MDFSTLINSRNNILSQLSDLKANLDLTRKKYSTQIDQKKKDIEKLVTKINLNFLSIF